MERMEMEKPQNRLEVFNMMMMLMMMMIMMMILMMLMRA